VAAARDPGELDAVVSLCDGFVRWNRTRYADLGWLIERSYGLSEWGAYLARLPRLYAPPAGDIAVASMGSEPVGCAVLHALDGRTCEIKHLSVRAAARTHGVGRRLCRYRMGVAPGVFLDGASDLTAQTVHEFKEPEIIAAEPGYRRIVLETGARNIEAMAPYERLGFERSAPRSPYPPEIRALMVFMSIDPCPEPGAVDQHHGSNPDRRSS